MDEEDRLSAEQAVQEELDEVVQSLCAASGGSWRELMEGRNLKALVIGVGLVVLQQITGQPSVLYYAATIFTEAGFGAQANLSTVWVGLIKLLFTMASVLFVDKFGRRRLLNIGVGMMLVALIGMALSFSNSTVDASSAAPVLAAPWSNLALASMMLYVAGYQVGFGPIAWVMISEIFPLQVRSRALTLAVWSNFGTNLLVVASFNSLLALASIQGLFVLYAVMSALSLVFINTRVPETKGKSLEQIERLLD